MEKRWTRFIIIGCVLVFFFALLSRRERDRPETERTITTNARQATAVDSPGRKPGFGWARSSASSPTLTAEEIVASKVLQFGRNRRELVRKIARQTGRAIPAVVDKFFDAV